MKHIISFVLIFSLLLGISGCGKAEDVSADLTAVYEEMQQTLPEMILLDETTMLDFLGIEMENCKQAIAATCADGLITDEVWLIEAKDADTANQIYDLAQTRLAAKAEESISYSPEQYAVVQKAQLLKNGNYLALLVSPDVGTLQTVFENAMK